MQTARTMKQLVGSARLALRTFASTPEAGAAVAYNPAKGPKGAYVPADARKASDNAKSLFRKYGLGRLAALGQGGDPRGQAADREGGRAI